MRLLQSAALLAATVTSSAAGASEVNTTSVRELSPMVDSVAAQLCGVDIVGYDLTSFKYANPDGCLAPCYLRNRESNAATWTNYEGGTCWCKKVPESGWGFLSPNPGAATLVNGRPLTNGVEIVIWSWSNVNTEGNDIGNVEAKHFSVCSNECMKWDRCFAHTWTNYNGGTCWMKSAVGTRGTQNGAMSGYVARQFVRGACRV